MNDKRSNTVARTLEFSGERYVPELRGNIELEHVHRYLFARQLVTGKCVLDIASGEGYGSAILAQGAARVTGVDISPEAVSYAAGKYKADNLEFLVGACSAIPIEDNSVDIVVSFETIEHHNEHEAMMREIKRVMRPGGLLVISTPDKFEYSDKLNYSNPYHVSELYREEFKGLLTSHFKNFSLYGQRIIFGSAIFCEDTPRVVETVELSDESMTPHRGLAHAVFLVAIASDKQPPVVNSGFLEKEFYDTEIRKHLKALTDWATSADTYAKAKVEEVAQLQAAFETERSVRETEHAEAIKQVQALTRWATSADAYAKSKVEEVGQLQAAFETERSARETEHAEAIKQVQALTKWATSADAYAKSKVEEVGQLQAALEAERSARETEHAEAIKQVQALTRWATSADAYAKSKVEEVGQLQAALEAERSARETIQVESASKIAGVETALTSYKNHWIFRYLKRPHSN